MTTTRPLRHADDTGQELLNLRHRRDVLRQELEWLEAVISHIERGGVRPAHGQQNMSVQTEHQVGIDQPPQGWASEGGEYSGKRMPRRGM